MKIGVDARSLLCAHPRGEGKTLIQLYRGIARLRPSWEFVFFGQSGASAAAQNLGIANVTVIRFDLPGFRWGTWENIGVPGLAAYFGLDLLHGFSSGGPALLPVPFVMTVHDVIPLKFDDGLSKESTLRFRKRLAAGMRNARRVVAVSTSTKNDLLELFPDVPADLISVVPWGVDPRCNGDAGVSPTSASAPSSEPVVLAFGGGGAKRKNALGVLQVFSRVVARVPAARLVMVGVTNETERRDLLDMTRRLGIEGRVELMGFVSEDALDQCYSTACCVLYLSLYEGFGLPPLEAMARGVPVVASDRSSIPEVVGDGGFLVSPDSPDVAAAAVFRLIQDAELRETMARRALARSMHFSWPDSAKRMVEVFESV